MPQIEDRFLFSIEGIDQTLRVVRFAGVEAVSELFELDLTFATSDPAIDMDAALGRAAVLTLRGEDGEDRWVQGIVSRFEEGDTGKKLSLYHVTVVPKAWRLEHRHDCRIFQDLTTPDIVQKVLTGAGLSSSADFRVALQASYRPREYCVQYRESDWAFACRLMEEEGIFWFFEHHADRHVLVLGDRPAAHAPIPGDATVVFRAPTGALSDREHVSRFHFAGEVRPGRVTLRDYDFKKPALLLEGEARATADPDLEIYDYPGAYDAPASGREIARLRLEERQARRRVGDGESCSQRLCAGFTFQLAEHARDALNRSYLVTRIEYSGFEPAMGEVEAHAGQPRYESRFQCIPDDVPFRPPSLTPRPSMRGVQTAIVVGPAGEEIHTDAHGRVKVQFHWDRQGKKDEHSSCWMRVSQTWAGEAWGAMHVPRVGQEVIVDFLEGDPDRPIVVGRVYHGTNVPPYGLPDRRTVSTVKSSSTPGGGGSNELRFEDKKGSEEVYVHAQKDLLAVIEHDASRTVGHDDALAVKNDQSLKIDHDQQETIGNDRSRAVGRDEGESIGRHRTISVGGDHTEDVAGAVTLTIGKTMTEEVASDASISVGGALSLTVSSDLTVEVSGDGAAKTGGSAKEEVGLDKTLTVGSQLTIECGAAKVVVDKSGKITITGTTIEIAADGPLSLKGADVSVNASGNLAIEASGPVKLRGSGPMQIDASGAVKLKGARVGIN